MRAKNCVTTAIGVAVSEIWKSVFSSSSQYRPKFKRKFEQIQSLFRSWVRTESCHDFSSSQCVILEYRESTNIIELFSQKMARKLSGDACSLRTPQKVDEKRWKNSWSWLKCTTNSQSWIQSLLKIVLKAWDLFSLGSEAHRVLSNI